MSDAHTHTTFCDGQNTPREMAEQALALGYTGLGFSSHSPAPFDDTCPGLLGKEAAYRTAIAELKQEYAGRLDILCGVEQDYAGPIRREDYDYIVGSVHYLPNRDGELVAVDGTVEHMQQLIQGVFKGDEAAFCSAFYDTTVENVRKYHPEIVGHFDLIVKHNVGNNLFNEAEKSYRAIVSTAMDAVIDETLSYGGIIELNTGGIGRGYRTQPYPALFLLEQMARRGANVMITSDAHSTANLNFWFTEGLELVKRSGFKTLWMLQNSRFEEFEIDQFIRPVLK